MPEETQWRCPECGSVRVMDHQPEPCVGYPDEHEPAEFEGLAERNARRTDGVFRSLADVEQKRVQWLWKPYLPIGHVTLMGGDGGVGKSTLTARVAATVTTGEAFPNAWRPMSGEPASVLIMNAEDDLSTILAPRLSAAGANLSMVEAVDFSLKESDTLAVLGDETFDAIDRNMKRLRPRLVVVDPIVSFMGDRRDMNRANEIRPMLRRLGVLATRHRCAMLVVGHLNKNEGTSATNRFNGTADFRNAARSMLLVGKVDGEPDRGLGLFHNKSNYAHLADPLGYEFEAVEGYDVAAARWKPSTDLTEGEVFQGRAPSVPRTKTAEGLITTVLKGMPGQAAPGDWMREVLKAAMPGVSDGTLQKARKNAGIVIARDGSGATEWSLLSLAVRAASRLDSWE